MEKSREGGASVFQRGVDHARTGNQHKVPTGGERGEHRTYRFAQQSFGSIPLDSISNCSSCCHAHAQALLFTRLGYQDNKRVGIGRAVSPHPLELIRMGQAIFVLHPHLIQGWESLPRVSRQAQSYQRIRLTCSFERVVSL